LFGLKRCANVVLGDLQIHGLLLAIEGLKGMAIVDRFYWCRWMDGWMGYCCLDGDNGEWNEWKGMDWDGMG